MNTADLIEILDEYARTGILYEHSISKLEDLLDAIEGLTSEVNRTIRKEKKIQW